MKYLRKCLVDMIRTGIMKILMWAIVPIALTLVFLATVDYEKSGMWVSLVFIWLAYFTVSYTCLYKWGKQLSILNWSLYLCAMGYFLAELVAAVLFLYVLSDYPQWSFSVQLLLFVTYVLLFGVTYIANHKTDHQMREFRVNDSRVKQWRKKVALMQSVTPSNEIKELSDLLSITPIMSTPEVSSIDDEISMMIESDLKDIDLIINKIKERNIILKFHTI